eukprot:TRINITY_DN2178_c0_g2_i1.p1 TRINITY_DN2178_c0_g2~~TRINITY_DN2178_c0_g2_i1.p1  ORF type:complete len:340 (+),score=47.00 TRINITY_DN2178_c0_g2_i1:45-1022(+)
MKNEDMSKKSIVLVMSSKQTPQKVDKVRELADALRQKGGVENRVAVVGQDRLDYFRGKDFARHFRKKPEILGTLVEPPKPEKNRTVDDAIADLIRLLIRKQLILACDRRYKKPKPGKKRVVKFPRKLVPYEQKGQDWNEENFYAWLYERPTPAWQYILSGVALLALVAVCFYPLAPIWLKIKVAEVSLYLLIFIFAILIIRFVVFLGLWITTGNEFWILPDLLEDVPPQKAVAKLYSFKAPEEGKSTLITRALATALTIGVFWLLYVYTPGANINIKTARDQLLDILDLQEPKQSLAGGNDTIINDTIINEEEVKVEQEQYDQEL